MAWLRDMLATPIREPSQFTAALAHIVHLPPADALEQHQMRQVNLEATIAAWRAVEHGVSALIDRRSILELEYSRCLADAELAWVHSVIDDLRSGNLTWDFDKIKSSINNTEFQLDNFESSEGSA